VSIVGPDLVVSKDTFPAESLTNPSTPNKDVKDETVYLTMAIQNQVSTEISMIAELLQSGTVFPFR
jgi:hypothetical protein